ncbi:MAG: peptidoglycan DL-endopeptidase RipB, partial [Mycobacterium sp.]|nr:peptidoglycan DL-endopeptidase RipB [Mycobacterium sp.]
MVQATPAQADPVGGGWDPLLPKLLSAGAPGDPLAIANASLQATANAALTTMDLGRQFLTGLGIIPNADPGATLSGNRVYGKQAI